MVFEGLTFRKEGIPAADPREVLAEDAGFLDDGAGRLVWADFAFVAVRDFVDEAAFAGLAEDFFFDFPDAEERGLDWLEKDFEEEEVSPLSEEEDFTLCVPESDALGDSGLAMEGAEGEAGLANEAGGIWGCEEGIPKPVEGVGATAGRNGVGAAVFWEEGTICGNCGVLVSTMISPHLCVMSENDRRSSVPWHPNVRNIEH